MSDTTTTETRPQPVLNAQLVAQGASVVLAALVAFGLISTGQSDVLKDGVGYGLGALPIIAAIVGAFHGRSKVTPVADARDENSEPLATTAELRETANASYTAGRIDGITSVQPDPDLVALAKAALADYDAKEDDSK